MSEKAPPSETPAKPRRGIYLLPNLLTTGALFAGFYAIVGAMNGQFTDACIALIVAAFLDAMDGRIARLTNTQSDFGVQFDSLSDMVCFGLAPALLIYLWSLAGLADYGPVLRKVGWLAAFLFAACAALRLARFNAQVGVADKAYFQGLASPAAAALLVTLVWACEAESISGASMVLVALAATVVGALLMVSNIRFFSFKQWPHHDRVPFLWILGGLLLIVLLAIDTPKLLLAVAYIYAASGPILTVTGRSRWRSRRRGQAGESD